MKISFVIQNFYGLGGTNSAVLNLANALTQRNQVEVVSVYRRQDMFSLDIGDAISVRPLLDVRLGQNDRWNPKLKSPSQLVPPGEEYYSQYNQLTDERLSSFFRSTEADVVITTRPSLNLVMAKLGRSHYVKVAQEHMTHDMIPSSVIDEIRNHYSGLDAAVCLTAADADGLRSSLGPCPVRVVSLPNAVPEPSIPSASLDSKIVVAAGRMAEVKRYDLLIHAFASVHRDLPDWRLRLYGSGPEFTRIRHLIHQLELEESVLLMGRYPSLESEWVKGSICAVTSTHESFGMTLVEAMRSGLPVVSTACPVGPSEIITHDVDGLLTPVNSVEDFALALRRLMKDAPLRKAMGAAALRNSRRFDPAQVASSYEELFASLRVPKSIPNQIAANISPARIRSVFSNRTNSVAGRLKSLVGRGSGLLHAPAAHPEVQANCRSTATGEIEVLVDLAHIAGQKWQLLLRERGATDGLGMVAVSMTSDLEGCFAVALIGFDQPLCEGRWNLFLKVDDQPSIRLTAGVRDLRTIVGGRSFGLDDPVQILLPYRTADGFLSVRVWSRAQHIECDRIALAEDVLHVSGKAYGCSLAPDAKLVLTRRQSDKAEVEYEVSSHGPEFASKIDLNPLMSHRITRHDDWDLWLRNGPEGELVRLARLLDDVDDRKVVYNFPAAVMDPHDPFPEVEEFPAPSIRIRPYLSVNSEVCIYVKEP